MVTREIQQNFSTRLLSRTIIARPCLLVILNRCDVNREINSSLSQEFLPKRAFSELTTSTFSETLAIIKMFLLFPLISRSTLKCSVTDGGKSLTTIVN